MLLVDDVETLRFALSAFFHRVGWTVDDASGLDEALARIATRAYALVVTDLRFADQSENGGLEVVRAARTRSPTTRIVVLTAYGNAEVEARARADGADLFLSKPQSLPRLVDRIDALFTEEVPS
jgi:CheY-like chemotaxis protein